MFIIFAIITTCVLGLILNGAYQSFTMSEKHSNKPRQLSPDERLARAYRSAAVMQLSIKPSDDELEMYHGDTETVSSAQANLGLKIIFVCCILRGVWAYFT